MTSTVGDAGKPVSEESIVLRPCDTGGAHGRLMPCSSMLELDTARKIDCPAGSSMVDGSNGP